MQTWRLVFFTAMILFLLGPTSVHAATYKQAEYIMGTVFEITLDSPQPLTEKDRNAFFQPLFAQLRAHDQHLSNYRHDSELSLAVIKVQAEAQPLKLSPLLCGALTRAKHYHKATRALLILRWARLYSSGDSKTKKSGCPLRKTLHKPLNSPGSAG